MVDRPTVVAGTGSERVRVGVGAVPQGGFAPAACCGGEIGLLFRLSLGGLLLRRLLLGPFQCLVRGRRLLALSTRTCFHTSREYLLFSLERNGKHPDVDRLLAALEHDMPRVADRQINRISIVGLKTFLRTVTRANTRSLYEYVAKEGGEATAEELCGWKFAEE